MKFAFAILGLSLWLSEFTVCSLHSDAPTEDDTDSDDDGNDQAVQIAQTVQGDDAEVAEVAGPQTPASAPSIVNMASSLDRFGANASSATMKPGWDVIKLVRANMCVDMLTKHDDNFENKQKCIVFMDESCGQKWISSPSGKGHCTKWYKLLELDRKMISAAPAPAAAPKAAKVEEGDAPSAHKSMETAKHAATAANKIATDSVQLADNAKWSLEKARDAVHTARVASSGLSESQKHSLKTAEAKLKEATKKAEYGQIKNAKYVKAKVENEKLQKMEKKMAKLKKEPTKKNKDELEAMRREIEDLRKQLKKKEGDTADNDALLKDLQDQIKEMEKAEKHDDKKDKKSHDELKAEIERLRAEIKDMQDAEPPPAKKFSYSIPAQKEEKPVQQEEEKEETVEKPVQQEEEKEETVEKYKVNMKPLSKSAQVEEEDEQVSGEATPVEQKGIDIDTAMPYGDLEPFGREDTAQELTENSIKESDDMVDQLERAEVAEEKRSVFRALTRLRGAAITSFDGVARSQTGNIDEYNQVHKWRNNHPLHHLADEESDVSKWAFPDNAD